MMRENILGLEAVLADGTIISSMNSLLKNNSGYDLKQLFIGAEGTLGFVTRAVLRLRPETTTQNKALLAIPDFDSLVTFFQTVGAKLGDTQSQDFTFGAAISPQYAWPKMNELIPYMFLKQRRQGQEIQSHAALGA